MTAGIRVGVDPERLAALAVAVGDRGRWLSEAAARLPAAATGEPYLDEVLAALLDGLRVQLLTDAARIQTMADRLARAALAYAATESSWGRPGRPPAPE